MVEAGSYTSRQSPPHHSGLWEARDVRGAGGMDDGFWTREDVRLTEGKAGAPVFWISTRPAGDDKGDTRDS